MFSKYDHKCLKAKKNIETRGRKRKTTVNEDRMIVRMAKKDPFVTSTEIKKTLKLDLTKQTICSRLREKNLIARSARKVPHLSKKNVTNRLKFAKRHHDWSGKESIRNWRGILWSDESKVNLFGSDSKHYVRRPTNQEFNPKYTKKKNIKHGGGSIMVWGCFSWYGVGPIHWIKTTMTQEVYIDILDNIMLPYARENMPSSWCFQQDNDPKHTSKRTKQWFIQNEVNLMEWPAQSPDLNPLENLWHEVKTKIANIKHKNKQELWCSIKEAWESIPVATCQKLVDSMPKRCEAVLKNKGYAKKY